MKTAILLFGDYRVFEKASVSYEVFNSLDVDYYISTWDKTTLYDDFFNSQIESITNDRINSFLPHKAVFTSISNEEDFNHLDDTQKMIRHWKVLGDALKESEVKYDNVLLLRVDYYVDNFNVVKFIEEGTDGKLHIDHSGLEIQNGLHVVGDTYHSGSPELILKYIDMIPLITAIVTHRDFGSILFHSRIEVDKVRSLGGGVLRPTTAKLMNTNHESNVEFMRTNPESISILFDIYTHWYWEHNVGELDKRITFREYIKNRLYLKILEKPNEFKIKELLGI